MPEADDELNPDVLSSIAHDMCERYGRDWFFVCCGQFDSDQMELTVGTHPRVKNRELAVFQKIETAALFLKRLLDHADGEQLPPGLSKIIFSIATKTAMSGEVTRKG